MRNLVKIQERESDLKGVTVLGITADSLENLRETAGPRASAIKVQVHMAAAAQRKLGFAKLAQTPGGEAFRAFDCWKADTKKGPIPVPTCVISDAEGKIAFIERHDSLLVRTHPDVVVREIAALRARAAVNP